MHMYGAARDYPVRRLAEACRCTSGPHLYASRWGETSSASADRVGRPSIKNVALASADDARQGVTRVSSPQHEGFGNKAQSVLHVIAAVLSALHNSFLQRSCCKHDPPCRRLLGFRVFRVRVSFLQRACCKHDPPCRRRGPGRNAARAQRWGLLSLPYMQRECLLLLSSAINACNTLMLLLGSCWPSATNSLTTAAPARRAAAAPAARAPPQAGRPGDRPPPQPPQRLRPPLLPPLGLLLTPRASFSLNRHCWHSRRRRACSR